MSSNTSKMNSTELIDLSTSTKKTGYFTKDCAKFSRATKLISRGSQNSSSHAYAVAVGVNQANTGKYTSDDIVAVSAEGRRANRIPPDVEELNCAIRAGVKMFLTDTLTVRNSTYNIGEREVADILMHGGYVDPKGSGEWQKVITSITYIKSIWTGCMKKECQKEWLELSDGTTQEEQDKDYASGNYGLQHCEIDGCHDIYWRGKNGTNCEFCDKHMCESGLLSWPILLNHASPKNYELHTSI